VRSGARKTAIVTGASQGIGAGIVKRLRERDFDVVANSRRVTQSTEVEPSDHVALVDGTSAIRQLPPKSSRRPCPLWLDRRTGQQRRPLRRQGVHRLHRRRLQVARLDECRGLPVRHQLSIKQMLRQETGGSIVTITAALARNPIRASRHRCDDHQGGLETVTQHLAMEYAKCGIRVNAVAPGVVYTPLHRDTPKEVMDGLSPMGRPSTVRDITDAVST